MRLAALLSGQDTVAPFFRLDAADILARLLNAPAGEAEDVARLDAALRSWFEAALSRPAPRGVAWNAIAGEAGEAIALLGVLRLPRAATWLGARLGEALAWAAALSLPTSRDLRAELWRGLAANQADRRFAARWLAMCAEVGRGDLSHSYLRVAMSGLQAMPRGPDATGFPADEVLAGFLAWARRLPNSAEGKARFQREWQSLAALHPRAPDHWQARLVAILAGEPCRYVAAWWMGQIAPGAAPAPSKPMVRRRPPMANA